MSLTEKLPGPFLESLSQVFPEASEESAFLRSLQSESPTSIRINPTKTGQLSNHASVQWNPHGYYLESRPSFVADPLWHAGHYYVQEASSMITGHVMRQLRKKVDGPVRVLDLCAAPGGKSTDILSQLEEEDTLVSNEFVRSRSNILAENISKWGRANAMVTHNEPADFATLKGLFDIVVIDAPCSGEGLFRKDHEAIKEWSPANVQLCVDRQESIIQDVWPALREGGYLMYSTCTYNPKENEDILKWMLSTLDVSPVTIEMDENWGFQGNEINGAKLFHAFPHRVKGEGFSFCVLQKLESAQAGKFKLRKQYPTFTHDALDAKNGQFLIKDDTAWYISDPELFFRADHHLNLIKPGIEMGLFKKKNKLVPAADLALASDLREAAFEEVPLDYDQAIRYLRKDTFDLTAARGYNIVTYREAKLGFINHLGNRFNNMYPAPWRIRTAADLNDPKIL